MAITTINGSDNIGSSRTTINDNFTDLDLNKANISDLGDLATLDTVGVDEVSDDIALACTDRHAITDYTFTGVERRNGGYLVTTASNRTVNIDADLFTNGVEFSFCKWTNNANTVTLDAGSGNNINGSQTLIITQYNEFITLVKDGANTLKVKSHYYPGLKNALDGKLPSTNTKAQFDTACTDDNFAFLGQSNIYTVNQSIPLNAPQGFLINGKIVTSVSSGNLTVAIKTLAGTDPSATDPVYCRIGDTVRTITSAKSYFGDQSNNWFNLNSSELRGQDTDLFIYLGWDTANSAVRLLLSRIPYGINYGNFSTTPSNEKYIAVNGPQGFVSTDLLENIGRVNVILSASNVWSIPATSIIVNRPIYETRMLQFISTLTWDGVAPTGGTNLNYQYQLKSNQCFIRASGYSLTAGVGNTLLQSSLPFSASGGAANIYQIPSHIGIADTPNLCYGEINYQSNSVLYIKCISVNTTYFNYTGYYQI